MDLKFKGKSWAGNIYHQFESICQDVDGFMNKDTVKFVENQVQSVGVNFKRFYSNVVQDILPLSGETVKSESQPVEGELVDTQDHVNSVTDVMTEPICFDENHISANQSSIDTTRNSDLPLATKIGHGMQFTRAPYADLSQEEESHLHFQEDDDDILSSDDNTKDSMPLTTKSSSGKDISSETSDGDHDNSVLTVDSLPGPSAHETGTSDEDRKDSALDAYSSPATIKKETISWNSYSDDSNIFSITDSGFGSKLPMSENPNISALLGTSADKGHECVRMDSLSPSSISDENRSVSALSVTSANKVNELKCPTMDSSLPSTSDAADGALATNETFRDSVLIKDESFDASISVQSSDSTFSFFLDEERMMSGHLYTSSTSPKFSNFLKSRSASFSKNVEDIHDFHDKSGHYAYNVSTLSEAVSYENKAVDVLPALLITELNENAFQMNTPKFVGSSERHEQPPQKRESKLLIPSSEIGITHDLNMETIDLSSDAKHDEESIVLNATYTRSTSHRTKNFQYYKKLIQDAFTSQKRLSKEYRHLPILYGDIDKESGQNFRPSTAPSSPDKYLHAVGKHSSSQETCESEWELL